MRKCPACGGELFHRTGCPIGRREDEEREHRDRVLEEEQKQTRLAEEAAEYARQIREEAEARAEEQAETEEREREKRAEAVASDNRATRRSKAAQAARNEAATEALFRLKVQARNAERNLATQQDEAYATVRVVHMATSRLSPTDLRPDQREELVNFTVVLEGLLETTAQAVAERDLDATSLAQIVDLEIEWSSLLWDLCEASNLASRPFSNPGFLVDRSADDLASNCQKFIDLQTQCFGNTASLLEKVPKDLLSLFSFPGAGIGLVTISDDLRERASDNERFSLDQVLNQAETLVGSLKLVFARGVGESEKDKALLKAGHAQLLLMAYGETCGRQITTTADKISEALTQIKRFEVDSQRGGKLKEFSETSPDLFRTIERTVAMVLRELASPSAKATSSTRTPVDELQHQADALKKLIAQVPESVDTPPSATLANPHLSLPAPHSQFRGWQRPAIAIVLLVAVGGGAWLFLKHEASTEVDAPTAREPEPPAVVPSSTPPRPASDTHCGHPGHSPGNRDVPSNWTSWRCEEVSSAGSRWPLCLRRLEYTQEAGMGCAGRARCCPP